MHRTDSTQPRSARVVVIGAGLAGLAAARWLARQGIQVSVFEKSERVGGRVMTVPLDGFTVDVGAQILAGFYRDTWQLFTELGLPRELIVRPQHSGILRGEHIYELDPSLRAILSPLLSLRSKAAFLRVVPPLLAHWRQLDLYHPEKAAPLDTETLAAYARRVLGAETLETLLDPLLEGILYWTPTHTSRAILFVMLKAALHLEILTLRNGLGQLPEAMAASLEVQRGVAVVRVAQDETGKYLIRVRTSDQEREIEADGVVCATPATEVPTLFPTLDARQQAFFRAVRYSSTVVAAIGLKQRFPANVFSFFPAHTASRIAAVTIELNKRTGNPSPVSDGRDAIALYATHEAAQQLLAQDDATIIDALWSDLLRLGVAPELGERSGLAAVQRWPQALPEFDVGHFRRLKHFAAGGIESELMTFAGDYLGGPFVEGAVSSGLEAAKRLIRRLHASTRAAR
jgi:protoporphyrinogen/coproporphyrinogen III oxidase